MAGQAGRTGQCRAGLGTTAPGRLGQVRAMSKSTGQDREAPRSVGRRSVPDRTEKVLAGLGIVREPDRDGKGSVKSAGPGWVGHGRL